MGIIVQAPPCRNGQLKNHDSIIEGKTTMWKDGIADLTEDQWEAVKDIPGYVKIKVMKQEARTKKAEIPETITSKPEPKPEPIVESEPIIPEPEIETADITLDKTAKNDETEPKSTQKRRLIGKKVTIDNTANEIKKFASRQVPPIDLGKCRTKSEMLKEIAKNFE